MKRPPRLPVVSKETVCSSALADCNTKEFIQTVKEENPRFVRALKYIASIIDEHCRNNPDDRLGEFEIFMSGVVLAYYLLRRQAIAEQMDAECV